MSQIPMPSPNGTNFEQLHIAARSPAAAYDAAPNVLARVETLLKGKVDDATITRVLQIARGGTANDAGLNGGDLINALFAWAARELTPEQASALELIIENNGDPRATVAGQSEDDPNSPHYKPNAMSMDARTRNSATTHSSAAAGYAARFPEASRIGVLG